MQAPQSRLELLLEPQLEKSPSEEESFKISIVYMM